VSSLRRRPIVIAAGVLAFVVAFAVVGLLSRSKPTAAATSTVQSSAGGPVPSASWYWTMAVSPTDPNVLVLGANNGLFRSADGGKTWSQVGPKNVNMTSLLQVGKAIYAGGVPSSPTAPPIVRTADARSAPTGTSVLAVSTDGGSTWKVVHPKGLPNVSLQALTVNPSGGTDLYALTTTGKLYRSTDGASSFSLVSPKLGVPPWALAETTNGQFVAGDMDNGASLGANAKAWKKESFTDPRGTKMVMEYAVQPSDASHVLMTSYGVESSTDGGKTWHVVLKSPVMFGPVAWAGSASNTAYAIGFDGSLWRTDDGGKTWTAVK
jgi:photosystem II stability/assembly factor-like uncharacterized protein